MTTSDFIQCPLFKAAKERPDAPAVRMRFSTVTYGKLHSLVDSVTDVLIREGVCGGDRIAIYANHGIEGVLYLWALLRLGAIACPISRRLPAGQVQALVARVGASAVVCSATAKIDVRRRRIVAGIPEGEGATVARESVLDLTAPATIIHTSGTTGGPKGVLHTLGSHYWSAVGANIHMPLSPGDTWMVSLPLYHVGGLAILFRSFLAGSAVYLPDPLSAWMDELGRSDVTHVSLVHTQLIRAMRDDIRPTSLKAVLVGGSAIPESLVREAVDKGWPVHMTYGLTEAASQVTATERGEALDALGSSGRVLPFRELTVTEEGRIAVRGRTLFAGYVGESGVDPAVDPDGWFVTNDMGTLGEDGRLRVLGRRDNMFVSGGENVQPEEIEQALTKVGRIDRVAVVPVKSAEFGFRPVAFIAPYPPSTELRQQILDSLRKVLPGFAVPVELLPWPSDAPDVAVGVTKIDRSRLAAVANDALRGRFG